MTDRALRDRLEGSILGTAQIVFVTANSAARLQASASKNEPFGAVVVDEAAQATEPSTLIPLGMARCSRCVLVGDDCQLPPTVFTMPRSDSLVCRTLFERLRQCGHATELLEEQYRMAPEISAFPRNYFYGGMLQDAPTVLKGTRRAFHSFIPPLLFLDLSFSSAQKCHDGSWCNIQEARWCAKIVLHLLRTCERTGETDSSNDLGIICPYKAQQKNSQGGTGANLSFSEPKHSANS